MRARNIYELLIYHLNYVLRLIIGRRKTDFTKYTQPFNCTADAIVQYRNNTQLRIINNKWGIFKLNKRKNVPLVEEYIQGVNNHQWIFTTPNKNFGVLGYPNILLFETLGQVMQATLSGARFSYDFTLDLEKCKKFNLALDMWIQTSPTYDIRNTINEIMIWEDYFVAKPAGKRIGKIYHYSSWYDVYHGWIDKSKEPNSQIDGWFLTSFVRRDRDTMGSINISDFLAYLAAEEIIDREHFVNRVEFGTEVYNAQGVVTINSITPRSFSAV